MSDRITMGVVNAIYNKVDIVEFIRQHVKLENTGSAYVGKCPFHEDERSSLSVSLPKKSFRCYSCDARGDVIDFV